MAEQQSLQQRMQRVEELVRKIENLPDETAKSTALELMQSLMEFHGAGLERMMVRLFLSSLAKKHSEPVPVIDHQVCGAGIVSLAWEFAKLRNAVEHALTDCEGRAIGMEHLPLRIRQHVAAVESKAVAWRWLGGSSDCHGDGAANALAQPR